jgi:hypothetical protein
VDFRYFELHDLLCDAIIALEGKNYTEAAAKIQKAITWAEADWLATASELPRLGGSVVTIPEDDDDDD